MSLHISEIMAGISWLNVAQTEIVQSDEIDLETVVTIPDADLPEPGSFEFTFSEDVIPEESPAPQNIETGAITVPPIVVKAAKIELTLERAQADTPNVPETVGQLSADKRITIPAIPTGFQHVETAIKHQKPDLTSIQKPDASDFPVAQTITSIPAAEVKPLPNEMPDTLVKAILPNLTKVDEIQLKSKFNWHDPVSTAPDHAIRKQTTVIIPTPAPKQDAIQFSITDVDPEVLSIPQEKQEAPLKSTSELSVRSTGAAINPQVIQQIIPKVSAAIIGKHAESVEIRLDPQELGKLIVTITQSETGTTATVTVEKVEVFDFVRRNADILAAELKKFGIDTDSLQFSHGNFADAHRHNANTDEPEVDSPEKPYIQTPILTLAAGNISTKLDIRL